MTKMGVGLHTREQPPGHVPINAQHFVWRLCRVYYAANAAVVRPTAVVRPVMYCCCRPKLLQRGGRYVTSPSSKLRTLCVCFSVWSFEVEQKLQNGGPQLAAMFRAELLYIHGVAPRQSDGHHLQEQHTPTRLDYPTAKRFEAFPTGMYSGATQLCAVRDLRAKKFRTDGHTACLSLLAT